MDHVRHGPTLGTSRFFGTGTLNSTHALYMGSNRFARGMNAPENDLVKLDKHAPNANSVSCLANTIQRYVVCETWFPTGVHNQVPRITLTSTHSAAILRLKLFPLQVVKYRTPFLAGFVFCGTVEKYVVKSGLHVACSCAPVNYCSTEGGGRMRINKISQSCHRCNGKSSSMKLINSNKPAVWSNINHWWCTQ